MTLQPTEGFMTQLSEQISTLNERMGCVHKPDRRAEFKVELQQKLSNTAEHDTPSRSLQRLSSKLIRISFLVWTMALHNATLSSSSSQLAKDSPNNGRDIDPRTWTPSTQQKGHA
ncbi:hypothetical protein Bca52824_094488 [Brassica carinata]|uniref:Uncharacterized protein n=1 Tax=Brassica carinata TaxID=52824 RepID=A0A8X7TJR9_BRACI|nr:hypothetical protein Bca52824_094488 [Brassica carinata]